MPFYEYVDIIGDPEANQSSIYSQDLRNNRRQNTQQVLRDTRIRYKRQHEIENIDNIGF